MNCPKCGTPNDSRSTFCGSCGYALQATGAATFSAHLKGESPPPPSPYPTGNMSSSPTYPANGSPPPYPTGNMPSSFTYPADGSNLPPPQRRRGKKGIIAILAVVVVVILVGAVLAGILYTSHSTSLSKLGTSSPTQSTTATLAPTSGTSSPTQSTTVTPTVTSASSSPTQSTTATPIPTSSDYSATQPGPGCDTNGGTWTPQRMSKITCGTQLSLSSPNSRGYLYFQLPNNQAFSSNNSIGITGNVGGDDCVGLAEQDANTGLLAEYCSSGQWFIYSISSAGAIIKTLDQSLTSTRTSEQLLVTLKGTTLSFSIDNEVHKITVSPIQPTKVAITFITTYAYGASTTITNFSYTVLTS